MSTPGGPVIPAPSLSDPACPRQVRRHASAAAAAVAITVAVELTIYFAARPTVGDLNALLATLAAGAIWTALAAPAMAAGASGVFGPLLRGGAVADASALSLLVLALASPRLGAMAAVEIYLIYLASALLAVAAVCCARTSWGRAAAAAMIAFLQMACLAGPFWIGGLLGKVPFPDNARLADWTMRINPFYSITGAVFPRGDYSWVNPPSLLYSLKIPSYVSASPRWYTAPLAWGAAAALLAGACLLAAAARRLRRRGGETPPAGA